MPEPEDKVRDLMAALEQSVADAKASRDQKLNNDRLVAATDMLRRTGAADIQIRYSDDTPPTVWFAVVRYRLNNGRPQPTGPITTWETAAGRNATEALLRLCEKVIDGGQCAHCHRAAMFIGHLDDNEGPLDSLVCITSYDPELKTYRRSCEGDHA